MRRAGQLAKPKRIDADIIARFADVTPPLVRTLVEIGTPLRLACSG